MTTNHFLIMKRGCRRLFRQGNDIRLQATDPASADVVPHDGQELEVWGVVTNTIKAMPV